MDLFAMFDSLQGVDVQVDFDADHSSDAHSVSTHDGVKHYDNYGDLQGSSHDRGDSSYHYDDHGALLGHSESYGARDMHYDSNGVLMGTSEQVGGQTYHYDLHHALVGVDHRLPGGRVSMMAPDGSVIGSMASKDGHLDAHHEKIINDFYSIFRR